MLLSYPRSQLLPVRLCPRLSAPECIPYLGVVPQIIACIGMHESAQGTLVYH